MLKERSVQVATYFYNTEEETHSLFDDFGEPLNDVAVDACFDGEGFTHFDLFDVNGECLNMGEPFYIDEPDADWPSHIPSRKEVLDFLLQS